jgi:MYXO-CTERM domain-containing protein
MVEHECRPGTAPVTRQIALVGQLPGSEEVLRTETVEVILECTEDIDAGSGLADVPDATHREDARTEADAGPRPRDSGTPPPLDVEGPSCGCSHTTPGDAAAALIMVAALGILVRRRHT